MPGVPSVQLSSHAPHNSASFIILTTLPRTRWFISVMPISGRSRYEQFSFCPTFSLPLIYRELERAPPAEWRVNQAAPLSMTLTNRDLHGRALVSMFLVPVSRIYIRGLQHHLESCSVFGGQLMVSVHDVTKTH